MSAQEPEEHADSMRKVETNRFSKLKFSAHTPAAHTRYGPRLGHLEIRRPNGGHFSVPTPALLTLTSRGVVPHLTRDHVLRGRAIKVVHVPFESFLEQSPPIIIDALSGEEPLHRFLGFNPEHHILTFSLRDPIDVRELPANGNKFLNALCVRGVRQVTPEQYRSYALKCRPDITFALCDTPFTPPPFSQKRVTKSLERTIAWLLNLLQPLPSDALSLDKREDSADRHPLNIILPMAGSSSISARRAFTSTLLENLHGKEAEQVHPIRKLDDGLFGYSFDLAGLRMELSASSFKSTNMDEPEAKKKEKMKTASPRNPRSNSSQPYPLPLDVHSSDFAILFHASLDELLSTKPRIVTGTANPHELLDLIREVGIDGFDANWAQRAADWGIALDFAFPVPEFGLDEPLVPKLQNGGLRDIGHNLYSAVYSSDFSRFSTHFLDGQRASSHPHVTNVCHCIACSPLAEPEAEIVHSSVDLLAKDVGTSADQVLIYHEKGAHSQPSCAPPFTRAYVHHLLHTHEMSAHALLAAHNLAVVEKFFEGIRSVLSRGLPSSHSEDVIASHHHTVQSSPHSGAVHVTEEALRQFDEEVKRFSSTYDSTLAVYSEAQKDWESVELARGKGRLAREKAKLSEATNGGETEKLEIELEELEVKDVA